jgi:hypothetical protein
LAAALVVEPASRSAGKPGSRKSAILFAFKVLLGAGSRAAVLLRFSVIFEYGGLIP